VVGTDRYAAYNWVDPRRRQLYWAHLKRDFIAFVERGGESARFCRKVASDTLLSTICGVFHIPSFQYIVWFINFATEPAAVRTLGQKMSGTLLLSMLAEAYGRNGQREAEQTVLTEALELVDENDERAYDVRVYQLQGELGSQGKETQCEEAAASFQKALNVARQQEAKSFELHAATSLARLWQRQGKTTEAHELLTPVYNWFAEGFDTADLKDTKALLAELTSTCLSDVFFTDGLRTSRRLLWTRQTFSASYSMPTGTAMPPAEMPSASSRSIVSAMTQELDTQLTALRAHATAMAAISNDNQLLEEMKKHQQMTDDLLASMIEQHDKMDARMESHHITRWSGMAHTWRAEFPPLPDH